MTKQQAIDRLRELIIKRSREATCAQDIQDMIMFEVIAEYLRLGLTETWESIYNRIRITIE